MGGFIKFEVANMNDSSVELLQNVLYFQKCAFWNDQDAVPLVALFLYNVKLRNWYPCHHDFGWLFGSWIKVGYLLTC